MAELDPLIKLLRKQVDDKQRVLADLYREAEELDNKKAAMLAEIEHEKKVLDDMDGLDTGTFFGPYVDGMRRKIEALDVERENLEKRIDLARDDVREGFAELKKVEITAERRAEEEAKEIAKKEDAMLDEMGLDAFRRQQEESED